MTGHLNGSKLSATGEGFGKRPLRENSRKGDLEEQVEGRTVLLHFGPQHRALPRVDDELCQRFGREVPGDRPGPLRLGDHRSDVVAPSGERLANPLAYHWTLIGQFCREIPKQTPGRELRLDCRLVQALAVFPEPPQRRELLVPQDVEEYPLLLLVLPHGLRGQDFLALEVVV